MKAKEMFKKLKLNCCDVKYIDEKIVKIVYHNDAGTRIDISKRGIDYTEDYYGRPVPLIFHEAITKQLEELGWNK